MKLKIWYTLLLIAILLGKGNLVFAQCAFVNQITDGFEYTSVCNSIVPGSTYQTTPQSYSVHSGSYSLYFNMQNCVGGAGTCIGDIFYRDTIEVCSNADYRFSAYFTTTFNAPQSNIQITVEDENNVVISNTASVLAPLSPTWIKFQSPTFTPTTSKIYISFYTNVDGGNGNDLSMDDFLLDICSPSGLHSSALKNICSNLSSVDLFSFIPGTPITTGSWTGPSTLGGYLGTFTPGINTYGTYIYNSLPFGAVAGCPTAADTIIAIPSISPNPKIGNDTLICTNQVLQLNSNVNPPATYLWNTGSTLQSIFVSSVVGATVNYFVTVTNPQGCSGNDTIGVTFQVCNGIDEISNSNLFEIFPNPTHNQISVNLKNSLNADFVLYDKIGKIVFKTPISTSSEKINLPTISNGLYYFSLKNGFDVIGNGKLIITD